MWATPTMKSISIHALREEGDDHGFEIQPEAAIFLSTPSARRATPHRLGVVQGQPISIHALREEGDLELYGVPAANIRFLSTPSARRATRLDRSEYIGGYNFYPRPPRGGRRDVLLRAAAHSSISIHALREEGDAGSSCGASCRSRFLSTPSARRATGLPGRSAGRPDNFYPRPPRGGRQVCRAEAPAGQIISIHALREEGDTSAAENLAVAGVFLSTPSARRATRVRNQPHRRKDNFYPRPPRGGRHCRDCQRNHTWRFLSTPSARRATPQLRRPTAHRAISIHALREEGDGCSTTTTPSQTYFYPRPPRGGRLPARPAESHDQRISIHALREEGDADGGIWKLEAKKFLSTPSARRATRPCTRISTTPSDFYPRPPRGGRRLRAAVTPLVRGDFYPRPPRGGRLAQSAQRSSVMRFLSTPSARRATLTEASGSSRPRNFYPRPPRGGRPGRVRAFQQHPRISIHALREEGDDFVPPSLPSSEGISIHALREEGDWPSRHSGRR